MVAELSGTYTTGVLVADRGPNARSDERMEQLVRLHAGPLRKFLLRLTFGDRQAADDLLQETLLRAWRHLAELHDGLETVGPWLFTVARRVAIDAARARGVRPSELGGADVTALPAGRDDIDRVLTQDVIRKAMRSLSPDHQAVVIELYARERSVAETAQRLGIPEGTVKSRAYHALRGLRAAIGAI